MAEQEWTEWIGLRRAGVHVAVRVPFAIVGWAALLWLAAPVLNFLPDLPHWAILGVLGLVMIAPGVAIAYLLSRNISETAGMVGLPIAIIVAVGAGVAIWAGAGLAAALRPIEDWQLGFSRFAACAWAVIYAIKATMLDEA